MDAIHDRGSRLADGAKKARMARVGREKAGRRGGDRRSAARDEADSALYPPERVPFNWTSWHARDKINRSVQVFFFSPPTFGSLRPKGIIKKLIALNIYSRDRFWWGFVPTLQFTVFLSPAWRVNEMPRGEQVRTVMISIWYSHNNITPYPFKERKLCTCTYGQQ